MSTAREKVAIILGVAAVAGPPAVAAATRLVKGFSDFFDATVAHKVSKVDGERLLGFYEDVTIPDKVFRDGKYHVHYGFKKKSSKQFHYFIVLEPAEPQADSSGSCCFMFHACELWKDSLYKKISGVSRDGGDESQLPEELQPELVIGQRGQYAVVLEPVKQRWRKSGYISHTLGRVQTVGREEILQAKLGAHVAKHSCHSCLEAADTLWHILRPTSWEYCVTCIEDRFPRLSLETVLRDFEKKKAMQPLPGQHEASVQGA